VPVEAIYSVILEIRRTKRFVVLVRAKIRSCLYLKLLQVALERVCLVNFNGRGSCWTKRRKPTSMKIVRLAL